MSHNEIEAWCAHCGKPVERTDSGEWWRHLGSLVGPCGYRLMTDEAVVCPHALYGEEDDEQAPWPAPRPQDHESEMFVRGELIAYGPTIYVDGDTIDSTTTVDGNPCAAGGAAEGMVADTWAYLAV